MVGPRKGSHFPIDPTGKRALKRGTPGRLAGATHCALGVVRSPRALDSARSLTRIKKARVRVALSLGGREGQD